MDLSWIVNPQVSNLRINYELIIYFNLKKEDSREVVMKKLREGGFLQIYEERDKELVKCTLRLNNFRWLLQ